VIVAWGDNTRGQTAVLSPNADFIAIAAGSDYSLGLKGVGTIVAWSSNGGDPPPDRGFVAMAIGGLYSLGLKSDGSIVAWGNNLFGQLKVPEPNADFVGIPAGSERSSGLKAGRPCAVPFPHATTEARDRGLQLRWGPNPVSGPATVAFKLPEHGRVSLDLFDGGGAPRRSLVRGRDE
jgi:hypothetical protein